MPSKEDVTQWGLAEDFFSHKPREPLQIEKLHRSDSLFHEPSAPNTDHSYLRFGPNILRLLPGENKPNGCIAGKGVSSRVKYLLDKDDIRYTVKIDNYMYAGEKKRGLQQESTLSLDIGFFKTVGYRIKPINPKKGRLREKSFRYAVMEDLGKQLFDYLKRNGTTLSDETRLNLAFQACFQIHQLHQGSSSKSGRKITHGDIKPANFYYDEKSNKLSLGDYGFSEYGPINRLPERTKGTPNYLPYQTKNPARTREIQQWTKVELDIFALKRTCYCPMQRNTMLGHVFLEEDIPPMILTKGLLEKYKLADYFKTTHNNEHNYDALFLASICLLASVNLSRLIPSIEQSKKHQKSIIALYFSKQLDEEHLTALIDAKDEFSSTPASLNP